MLSGRNQNKQILSLSPSVWQVNRAPSYYVFGILFFSSFYTLNTSPPALKQRDDIAMDRRLRTWNKRARRLTAALGVEKCKECNQNNGERAKSTSKQRKMYRCSSSSDDEADKQIRKGDKIE